MMERQEPLLSSSSAREVSQAPEKMLSKSVGCMSGLIQLVYKYHKPQRFLTSGKKQENNVISSPAKSSSSQQEISVNFTNHILPKSPTLSVEIMRVSPHLPDNFRSHPSVLVARLMGLSDSAAMESAVMEKRRRLLRAIDKCDEDLNTLKKMIDLVKRVSEKGNNNKIQLYYSGYREKGELEASPELVKDELIGSAFCDCSKSCTTNG